MVSLTDDALRILGYDPPKKPPVALATRSLKASSSSVFRLSTKLSKRLEDTKRSTLDYLSSSSCPSFSTPVHASFINPDMSSPFSSESESPELPIPSGAIPSKNTLYSSTQMSPIDRSIYPQHSYHSLVSSSSDEEDLISSFHKTNRVKNTETDANKNSDTMSLFADTSTSSLPSSIQRYRAIKSKQLNRSFDFSEGSSFGTLDFSFRSVGSD
ncbi:hypothetical protein P9112_006877 [Eukaryota sp. TZLM1-RC]